jgi:hypothetical protein
VYPTRLLDIQTPNHAARITPHPQLRTLKGCLLMPVKLREFVQDEWLTSGITRYARSGDFEDLSALAPNYNQRKLRRGPGWSSLQEHSALVNVQGMFFDAENQRYVVIGKASGSSTLQSGYFNAAWSFSGPYSIKSDRTTLGGRSMQNLAYYAGRLYLIDGTYNYVYRHTGYTSDMGSAWWDDSQTASILVPFGARLYMLTSAGEIWRINDGGSALESYLAPTEDFTPLYATPFKGYLLVVAHHDDGRLSLYRVSIPTATYFQELATIYNARVNLLDAGSLFAVHDDTLYFSPGPQDSSGEHTVEIFTYDGTVLEKHCEFTVDTAVGSGTAGFLTWQSKLIYYVLTESSPRFYALTGKHFTSYVPASLDFSSLTTLPIAKGLNDAILVTAHETSQGIYYATFDTRQDGHLITSRMDFGHPGRQKRLERLTAIVDGAVSSFDVRIKYRTDDTTDWTTLIGEDNTRTITSGGIGVDFYTLQVRIELDDDTGNHEDIAIEAISIIYTEPE